MKLRKFISKLDIKARPFNFYLNDGTIYYRTFTGGIFTLVLAVFLLSYSVQSFIIFFSREKYVL